MNSNVTKNVPILNSIHN